MKEMRAFRSLVWLYVTTPLLASHFWGAALTIDSNGLIGGKFWLGVNMGYQNVLPFSKAHFNMTAKELKDLHSVSVILLHVQCQCNAIVWVALLIHIEQPNHSMIARLWYLLSDEEALLG